MKKKICSKVGIATEEEAGEICDNCHNPIKIGERYDKRIGGHTDDGSYVAWYYLCFKCGPDPKLPVQFPCVNFEVENDND